MTSAFLHPFAKPAKVGFGRIVSGSGATVRDSEGREYIDGMANLWNSQIGHGRDDMARAIAAQVRKIECYNCFDPWTNEPAEALAVAVRDRSPMPDGRVFFCGSGSESVDSALKLARLVHFLRGEPWRARILTRVHGYHGVNYGGTTAQGIAPNRVGFGPLLPAFLRVPSDDLGAARAAFESYPGEIAAVLTEPFQGAGGVYPPEPGYLQGLRDLCDEHGALLIFDEVITGFGRMGTWFAAEHYGVTPDLLTFAKGVTSGYQPLGGVILNRACADVLSANPDYVLRHGYTYSGHPTACAAGLANIDIIEREGLLARAKHIGERMRARLEDQVARKVLQSFRGDGAVFAAQLHDGASAPLVRDRLLAEGVIVRPLGDCLAICPPLVITDEQLDAIFAAIDRVIG